MKPAKQLQRNRGGDVVTLTHWPPLKQVILAQGFGLTSGSSQKKPVKPN